MSFFRSWICCCLFFVLYCEYVSCVSFMLCCVAFILVVFPLCFIVAVVVVCFVFVSFNVFYSIPVFVCLLMCA